MDCNKRLGNQPQAVDGEGYEDQQLQHHLQVNSEQGNASKSKRKSRICSCWDVPLIHNKAVALVLAWNTLVFGYQFVLLHLLLSSKLIATSHPWIASFVIFFMNNVVSKLLYPAAGWLADVHFGRHKVIQYSMRLMWLGCLILLLERLLDSVIPTYYKVYSEGPIFSVVFLIDLFSLAGFHTNIIPFGIDQMPDASTEQLKAFIRWYYWTRNVGVSINIIINLFFCGVIGDLDYFTFISILLVSLFLTLAVSSDFIFSGMLNKQHKRQNPMYDMRMVLQYAAKHKQPVRRSAFTYNPAFNPTRIDYAMSFYGGPFSYEQVENVKTILNMLKVYAAFGCFILLQSSIFYSTHYFANHLQNVQKSECFEPGSMYWIFNPIFVVIMLPIFEFIVHPILSRRDLLPRTLRRVGVAICITLTAMLVYLVIDVVAHLITDQSSCMFNFNSDGSYVKLNLNGWYILPPLFLLTVAELMGNVGMFEFVCAQSPYSTRGFMIGLLYFTFAIFSLISYIITLMFGLSFLNGPILIDCGVWYYLVMIVLGVALFLVYVFVTRRYKRRQRQVIDNDQHVIEACYERIVTMTAGEKIVHIPLQESTRSGDFIHVPLHEQT